MNPDRSRVIGWVVMIASVLAVAISLVTGWESREHARCQARYNEINNERTRIITEVGADERAAERRRDDAQDATFLDPSLLRPADQRTPAEQQRVRDLFAEYLKAAEALKVERAKADKARADNPVPPPPSQTCD